LFLEKHIPCLFLFSLEIKEVLGKRGKRKIARWERFTVKALEKVKTPSDARKALA
jgi:hypothetical protein